MSKTFFTADTHFGHARIIELCNRPFASVQEMDEAMIARWNSVVKPEDTVWHLGDFCLANADIAYHDYAVALNGRINLIYGNHDRHTVRILPCWDQSLAYVEIKLDGWLVTLCHYAMRVWNGSYHKDSKSLMLYGHSHGMLPTIHNSLDVGVDCWDFTPVTLEQILAALAAFDSLNA